MNTRSTTCTDIDAGEIAIRCECGKLRSPKRRCGLRAAERSSARACGGVLTDLKVRPHGR